MECKSLDTKMIPISKIVMASILDAYGDIGRTEQLHTHWAARGLRKLQREVLKLGRQKVLLDVNRNTMTAALPVDFEEETFVGYIENDWKRVPLKINTNLVNMNSIRDVPCEDKCPKCDQSQSICNDLTVTETVELITINSAVYEKTVVKKLYPNGDYYLETTTPILNVDDNTVSNFTQKEFIANLDLKPCGCLETTEENLTTLRSCCPDVYCCYFSECAQACNPEQGSYLILEDVGLIQLSPHYRHEKLYLEYWSFLSRKNGQYMVPQVAFETLVNWIKFKSVENKPNVPLNDRQWHWQRYTVERRNMEKEMGRVSLTSILQASQRTPKLDIDYPRWRDCFYRQPQAETTTSTNTCDTTTTTTSSGSNTVIYLYKGILYKKVQFTVGDSSPITMTNGQTELTINGTQIFDNSVNVVLDGTTLYEDLPGSIYYSVVYSSTGVKITIYNMDFDNPSLNLGVQTGKKFRITYQQQTTT